jgi:hypothetical protein
MDQDLVFEINRLLFHPKTPTHNTIMHAEVYGKRGITAITHFNPTAEIAQLYRNIIISRVRRVYKDVVDIKQNQSSERSKIHTVPLIWYIGKCTLLPWR